MRISIKNMGKGFSIPIPSFILISSLGIKFLKSRYCRYYNNIGIDFSCIDAKVMRKMLKCIRKMKRIHKNWYLVEAKTPENSFVRIRL